MLPLLAATALAAEPDLVYFVLVDRFDNGDPGNDVAVDPDDLQAFHGGDLAGLTARLPYLADLGVRTVWLSPVFNMRTEKFHGHGAFHGYWVTDLDGIAPVFGGDEAMAALAEAAEDEGIRLVLDMVYNHTSFDAPRLESHPYWFHQDGSIEDWNDPTQLVRGQVHGLPDLAQEHPEVYDYLLSRSLQWARLPAVGGFRIDAVRHMDNAFFHALSADLKGELGADFWLLGEDFQGDARQLSVTFRQGGFDAMFDFPLRYALVDTVCKGAHPGRLAATLAQDRLYDDPAGLVTFLDNHDLPRVMSECGGDRGRVEVALLTLFALRGTPSIMYGTEWLLEGPGEPENRADMPWEERGPLADTIAALAEMRAEHPFLATARTRVVKMTDTQLSVDLIGSEKRARLEINLSADAQLAFAAPLEGVRVGAGQGVEDFDGLLPAGTAALLFPRAVEPDADDAVGVVRISLTGGDGGDVRVVGAGPELGDWSPASGLVLPAEVSLPAGAVMAYKLVRFDRHGKVRWEQTDNRYTLVAPGSTQIEARWEER